MLAAQFQSPTVLNALVNGLGCAWDPKTERDARGRHLMFYAVQNPVHRRRRRVMANIVRVLD